ncbi:acyl-CoA thioesterase [Flavihumibacter stibioxidans]|uniref:4-hydroxybenzoyl-CoA thioesterase n=1 Tax=Flavihumibacter stibioxidans TaxID=1834163 RepID=A0ABR7MBE1_9BACT|nr:acyl-CoA thioesterase [Flavihumibacter stibioxidans]MBC6491888.1 4-hydroxybenzoyl-CoA thioesterase [Flavihumibacter stibioxidans]
MKQVSLSHLTEVVVRFNEADPLGIVWHGHYVRYFEDGREAFGQEYGLSYLHIYKQGFTVPVVKIQCDYKKSLRYGDRMIIETMYTACDAARLEFNYTLYNAATRDIVAKGSTVQVFLDRENNLLQLTNPPFFEEWKQKYLKR